MVGPTVGILALQGGFADHAERLTQLDVRWRCVRSARDLEDCDALILPGGESTTQSHLLRVNGLEPVLRDFARTHPLFGTCAGLILMGRCEDPRVLSLNLLDARVERNAYGRQRESFTAPIELRLAPQTLSDFSAIFIRAPRIVMTGPAVEVLAFHNQQPVLIRQGLHMGMSFHPELTSDTRLHAAWLQQAFAQTQPARVLQHVAH